MKNVATDQKRRLFVNRFFVTVVAEVRKEDLNFPRQNSLSRSDTHLTLRAWAVFLCRKPLHLHTMALRFLGLCSITCPKKHRDRPPAEKPQWKIAFSWNSSLSQRSKSSQLETHHCQNLSQKDMDTKWKCPSQATTVVEKEAGVVEGNKESNKKYARSSSL